MAPLISVLLVLVFLLTLGGLVVAGEYENEPVCSHALSVGDAGNIFTCLCLNCDFILCDTRRARSSSRRLCLCSEKTEAARQHVSELPVF